MAQSGVKVDGFDELARGTLRLADKIEEAAPAAFEKPAGMAASLARSRVPHLTGAMAGSITAGRTVGGATVGYDGSAPYAGWVDFGGSRGRARVPGGRYLYPVALDHAGELLQMAGEQLAVDEIGGDEMAQPETVTSLPPPLPDVVTVSGDLAVRFTPNELRTLKAATGRTLDELMGETAEDADRMQAIVWLRLIRAGHDVTWQQAGDVAIEFVPDEPDPTSGEPSPSLPGFATSGAAPPATST